MVRNLVIFFLRKELVAPRPTPKLDDHPLSAVHDCLFNIFASISEQMAIVFLNIFNFMHIVHLPCTLYTWTSCNQRIALVHTSITTLTCSDAKSLIIITLV